MTELNSTAHTKGFVVKVARWNKAMKIISILGDFGKNGGKGKERLSLLDIGTGNGEIAHFMGEFYNVVSVDVTDQRDVHEGFTFMQLDEQELPFADNHFDVVVSNHVIEHVPDAEKHLSEIRRVLKNDGLVYLATPNRLWPWEAHNKIYLLHYLPAMTFNKLLNRLGRYHEDVYLLTWWVLNRKMKKTFSVNIVSDRICKWPLQYHMQCRTFTAKMLAWIPLWVYRMLTFINPTLVVVLKKQTSI